MVTDLLTWTNLITVVVGLGVASWLADKLNWFK